MHYLEVAGTPYEIGYQTGRATRLAIASTVDLLGKDFRHWDQPRFERVRREHMAYTEERWPELADEVRGLADGAGLPFELVYYTNFYASMRWGHEGCSNIIFTDTPDGPLLAKTNDLPATDGKHTMVRLIRPAGGMALLTTTWIGTVWRTAGINEAGLALGGSSCSARVTRPARHLNPHTIGGYILARCQTVDDAVALLEPLAVSDWGVNLPLADKSGAAAIIEKAGDVRQGVRRASGKTLWCTNHSVSAPMMPYQEQNAAALQESTERFDAIRRLIEGQTLSSDLMRRILAFAGRPGAVCRYGDDDPLHYETEMACLLYPARGHAEFCFSHPGRDRWHRFRLSPRPDSCAAPTPSPASGPPPL